MNNVNLSVALLDCKVPVFYKFDILPGQYSGNMAQSDMACVRPAWSLQITQVSNDNFLTVLAIIQMAKPYFQQLVGIFS